MRFRFESALNVDLDLALFSAIIPFGLHGRGITSLAALVRPAPTVEAVAARLEHLSQAVLGRRPRPVTATALPPVHATATATAGEGQV